MNNLYTIIEKLQSLSGSPQEEEMEMADKLMDMEDAKEYEEEGMFQEQTANPNLAAYHKDQGVTTPPEDEKQSSIGATTKPETSVTQQTSSIGSVTKPTTTPTTTGDDDEEQQIGPDGKPIQENVYVDVNVDPQEGHSGARIETDNTQDTQMILDLLRNAGIDTPILPNEKDNENIGVDVAVDPMNNNATTRVEATEKEDIDTLLQLLKIAGVEPGSISTAVNGAKTESKEEDLEEGEYSNSPDEEYADVDYMVKHSSGGLSGPQQHRKLGGQPGDNAVMPKIGQQTTNEELVNKLRGQLKMFLENHK